VLDRNLQLLDQGFYSRNAIKNRLESTNPEDEQKP
jgi:hypothetical protein